MCVMLYFIPILGYLRCRCIFATMMGLYTINPSKIQTTQRNLHPCSTDLETPLAATGRLQSARKQANQLKNDKSRSVFHSHHSDPFFSGCSSALEFLFSSSAHLFQRWVLSLEYVLSKAPHISLEVQLQEMLKT